METAISPVHLATESRFGVGLEDEPVCELPWGSVPESLISELKPLMRAGKWTS